METKIVSSIVAGSPKVLVSLYRYADSSDYYLVTNTIDLEGREIEITDSENTFFASWEQKASIGTFYYCSAYLNGLDQDYALLVNGESVTFAEEKVDSPCWHGSFIFTNQLFPSRWRFP